MQLIQLLRTCRIVGSCEVNGVSDSHAPTAGLVVEAKGAMRLPKSVAPTNPVRAATAVSSCGRDTSPVPERHEFSDAESTITRDGEPSSHDGRVSVRGRFR